MNNLTIKKNGIEITEIRSFKISKQNDASSHNLEVIAELTSNLMTLVDGDIEKDVIEITFGKTKIILRCKEFGASGVKCIGDLKNDPVLFYNCYASYEVNNL